jgi:IS1 family transposase
MNKLPLETRAQILQMLCEGSSMRSISRIVGVSINTVTKLLVDAGNACATYHDKHVRDVKAQRVQCDEIWAFCYSKAKNTSDEKKLDGAGDVWTWTGIDADNKLMISYLVGNRGAECAVELMDDLKSRLANRVQLTTDGHKAYLEAVEGTFGNEVDYAQLVKMYGETVEGQKRYSPAECVGIKKSKVTGNPDPCCVSTSFVERQNLNMRMGMRRFTRLTNAFSKKLENHFHALALYFMFYNFVRIHKTLKVTPAMAAGIETRLWEMADLVTITDDYLAAK